MDLYKFLYLYKLTELFVENKIDFDTYVKHIDIKYEFLLKSICQNPAHSQPGV